MQWVTVLVLFLILKKFFFEKVNNFIVARGQAIQDSIANAELINNKAEIKLETYNKRIANIESEGREIIKSAKIKAEHQANDILDSANKKAEEIINQAKHEIEREKVHAIQEMKSQIITYALMAAEKILEKNLEAEGQDALIDKIIEQAGTTGWRN